MPVFRISARLSHFPGSMDKVTVLGSMSCLRRSSVDMGRWCSRIGIRLHRDGASSFLQAADSTSRSHGKPSPVDSSCCSRRRWVSGTCPACRIPVLSWCYSFWYMKHLQAELLCRSFTLLTSFRCLAVVYHWIAAKHKVPRHLHRMTVLDLSLRQQHRLHHTGQRFQP